MLVETSALISWLRGAPTSAAGRLAAIARTGRPLWIPAVCAQEVLQGARDEREWARLHAFLSLQTPILPRDPWRSHLDAARIYFDARRRGLTIRSTIDCQVAQLALEHEIPLLHDDDDFESIRNVRPELALVR